MEKSKLLDIFRAIPTKEHRLFLEYVQSPYFNKRKDVMLLCQYLTKQAKVNYPSHALESSYCWRQLFPTTAYNKKEMAHLMSRLNQLAESFLGQRNFEKKEAVYPISTLEALVENRLEKHYQQSLKKIKTNIQASPLEDSDKLWIQYKVAEIEDFHFNLQNQRMVNPFISQKNNYLDQFFCQKKIQLFCTIEIIKNTLNISLTTTWPVISTLSQLTNKSNEVFRAYQTLYQLLKFNAKSKQNFIFFKAKLPFLKNKLSDNEYMDMYSFAINYCSLEFNKGKKNYAKHLLSLYEDGLAEGSLLVNNELSPWMYKNIVNLGLGLKRFEWTKKFILKYSEKLPKYQRKDAYHFNLANLNYYQKNYGFALEYLNQVEFTDIYYKHGSKAMLLKIYFEKNETEAFHSLESSFKILLMRDKNLPNELKSTYLNFIRFTAKLYKLKHHKDGNKLAKLRVAIEATPNINGRNWVMEQLAGVEGGSAGL